MAGVALVAAVDAALCLNGSFGHQRKTALDPKQPLKACSPNVPSTHVIGLSLLTPWVVLSHIKSIYGLA
jgi:hypothetical protein